MLLLFVCIVPTRLAAQAGSVSAAVIDANHYLLTSRLVGAVARVEYPFFNGPATFRAGVERLAGKSRRVGSPCSGLVLPGTCQPEPMRDNATMTSVSVGLGGRVLEWHRMTLSLTGDVGLLNVHVDSRGLTSGGSISAGKQLWDTDVGIEGGWAPWTRIPLALEAGIAGGHLAPVTNDVLVDGYSPFENSFDIVRVRVGVAWRFPSR